MEKITCPNCSHRFDIEGVIAKDIKAQLDQELQTERNKLIDDKKQIELELRKQMEEFESKKKRQNDRREGHGQGIASVRESRVGVTGRSVDGGQKSG